MSEDKRRDQENDDLPIVSESISENAMNYALTGDPKFLDIVENSQELDSERSDEFIEKHSHDIIEVYNAVLEKIEKAQKEGKEKEFKRLMEFYYYKFIDSKEKE